MRDISRSGAALEVVSAAVSGAVPEAGARVLVRFDADPAIHEDRLQLRGIVRNRRDGERVSTIGIEFDGLTKAQLEVLTRIVVTVGLEQFGQRDEEERRALFRTRAEWQGQVRPLDRGGSWERCWMSDISISGTGLEVAGHTVPPVGERVVVRFHVGAELHRDGLQLRGVVRNHRDGTPVPTIGVEFTGLTQSQAQVLAWILAKVERNRNQQAPPG
jgi:acylphosphatase